ncbi:MAG: hypothetical protein HY584_05050 [Candidatus Omnitrophica bacterium]|nr:hypothetical protein [Candidatus Omnitrophota bacterium]
MDSKDKRVSRIWKEIDEILWNAWDPIGVNGLEGARDEYQNYIAGVFRLLEAKATELRITEHLHQIETQQMGLKGGLPHCGEVARRLLNVNPSERH